MLQRIFALALGLALGAPVLAADTISATHVFPASLIYSRSFLEFVKKANDAGKGEFTIQVRGGPEAIGMMEQPGAVRSGVVDMGYSPCAFYAALERGTVDITAWTQIGLMDLNWDRYIKYRILPDFFETDLMIVMNQKKWSSLSAKTREILQRAAIEHESASLQSLQGLWKKEQAELAQRGIKTLAQSPEASRRFVAGARAASLARMKERTEKAGGMENYERVVQLFTPG